MRIEWVKINKRSYYFVDGVKITNDALLATLKGVCGEKGCREVFGDLLLCLAGLLASRY